MKAILKKVAQKAYSILSGRNSISRIDFLKKINSNSNILEIGPFTNPLVRGSNVKYFDVLTRDELVKRAKIENYIIDNPQEIPEINFVSPVGDLSIVDEKFDQILSSHCIEHQPDLIQHLNDAYNLLNVDGKYFIIMPDRRYCFDAKLPRTHIGNVIEAHLDKRKVHSLSNVVSYYALTTHNKAVKHWLGYHGLVKNISDNVKMSLAEFTSADGSYIDVHAWRFSPEEFVSIINLLKELEFINFKVFSYYTTTFTSNEFYVVLEKSDC